MRRRGSPKAVAEIVQGIVGPDLPIARGTYDGGRIGAGQRPCDAGGSFDDIDHGRGQVLQQQREQREYSIGVDEQSKPRSQDCERTGEWLPRADPGGG